MSSYKYWNSHYEDKLLWQNVSIKKIVKVYEIIWPSYRHNGISYPGILYKRYDKDVIEITLISTMIKWLFCFITGHGLYKFMICTSGAELRTFMNCVFKTWGGFSTDTCVLYLVQKWSNYVKYQQCMAQLGFIYHRSSTSSFMLSLIPSMWYT